MPLYLFARAAGAWTPHPVFFPDDAFYARLCLPGGLRLYWHDFGLYRILTILPYALVNRAVMRSDISPALLSFVAFACATVAFVWSCLSAGLNRRRAALLAGVLLGSPVLLETVNFWSGTLNYALVLLLVTIQLRACVWAHALTGKQTNESTGSALHGLKGDAKRGLLVTACGALSALLTYEIALPFVLATSALYVRGWLRRALTVGLAFVAAFALVGALAAAGLYWPQRFKLAAEKLTGAASTTSTDERDSADGRATSDGRESAHGQNNFQTGATTADGRSTTTEGHSTISDGHSMRSDGRMVTGDGRAQVFVATRASVSERARMYLSLLLSFAWTALRGSLWFWALALALSGLSFLPRGKPGAGARAAVEKSLPHGVAAFAFGVALAACTLYLASTKSMNARYAAFLLIYGAATLAWAHGRIAAAALASLLVLQTLVAAALPTHMRDVELATRGEAVASFAGGSDIISVNGRLARASWGKRFLALPAGDALTRPLNPRACRYAQPCEECK